MTTETDIDRHLKQHTRRWDHWPRPEAREHASDAPAVVQPEHAAHAASEVDDDEPAKWLTRRRFWLGYAAAFSVAVGCYLWRIA